MNENESINETPDPNEPINVNTPNTAATSEAQAELRQVRAERDDFLRLLREKQAEFENYQKRAARDRDQERQFAVWPLARDLLPALDNLERAMDAAVQAGDQGPLVQGVQATHTQVLDILKRFGIARIEADQQPFDPNLHQAVMQQPTAEVPPQTVIQVYQHGYTMHDRVLRPVSVVVSSPVEPTSGE